MYVEFIHTKFAACIFSTYCLSWFESEWSDLTISQPTVTKRLHITYKYSDMFDTAETMEIA